MRKIIFLLGIIFFIPNILWAADPIIGTWKLNFEKSDKKLPPQLVEIYKQYPRPKEAYQTYKEIEGDLLELTHKMIFADGSTRSSKWVCPKRGGRVKRLLPEPLTDDMLYTYTKLGSGEWILSYMKDNKQIHAMHKIVSEDGKTLNVTRYDTDPEGNVFKFKEVFDRQ